MTAEMLRMVRELLCDAQELRIVQVKSGESDRADAAWKRFNKTHEALEAEIAKYHARSPR